MSANTDSTTPATQPAANELPSLALACAPEAGHFHELRGRVASDASANNANETPDGLCANWQEFFAQAEAPTASQMDQRYTSLQRQIRDNGVTYNVYADQEGPQRPWSLDLFPLLLDPTSWDHIESGVLQGVRLLEVVMRDIYGAQEFLKHGLLPGALVHGHPGYLRNMHGVVPAGGVHLHVAAFDLSRDPDGMWWLVGQRTQAPSGLGYLLENRLAVSRQFPLAFESLRVQRLAATYRALMESLKALSPAGADSHIALMTPGPYNETYFEHAYLARHLGITLVEGSDLIVRDERLFLKTLQGLIPIHGLLKRVDDQYMDALELRADSTLGVPGLLQAIRAGNVLVANAPGSAFLESPALLGFWPALAKHVLGEELRLPALATWWCGEHSAMEEVLLYPAENTVNPTYPGSDIHEFFNSVIARHLNRMKLDALAGRILRQGEEHTVQAYLPYSQMPTWQVDGAGQGGHIVPRSVVLGVFAVSDGVAADGTPRWRVLPGGMAPVAGSSVDIASMQRDGSSADVWAMTQGEVDASTLLPEGSQGSLPARRKRLVTSRAAENLYWLGRYTERTENSVRLARLTLECLGG